MKFQIYQVKKDLVATHTYPFSILRKKGIKIELKNYDKVYQGESNVTDILDLLEALFDEFNVNKPDDFEGRSMSVSDIIQLGNKYFFCDSMGWQEVVFLTK